MKRLAMIVVLSTGLVAGPAMAEHGGGSVLNRENVGGALGAVMGGLAGNKLVKGDGRSLATAAGAVGGFVVGRSIAHNYGGGSYGPAGRQVGYSDPGRYDRRVYEPTGDYGQRRYSRTSGYEDGGYARTTVYDRGYDGGDYRRSSGYQERRQAHNKYTCCESKSRRSYPVHPIHEKYLAKCTSNVRAGPSTRYHVIDQVRDRELVTVIGKVRGRNWYKVRVGHRIGYIYAPLLERAYYSQNRHDDADGLYW